MLQIPDKNRAVDDTFMFFQFFHATLKTRLCTTAVVIPKYRYEFNCLEQ